ncbi:MAG: hypothetical protein ACW981_12730 [Candidatus Hodarchaeales archaeon]|jgi:hypothetical protein
MFGNKTVLKIFLIGLILLLLIPNGNVLANSDSFQDENNLVLKWQKTFDASGTSGPVFNPYLHKDIISTTSDEGLVLFLEFGSKFSLMKMDTDGNFLWNKTYSEEMDDVGGVFNTLDNGFLVPGRWYNESKSEWDFLVIKIASDGQIEWNKTYDYKNNTPQLISPFKMIEKVDSYIFSAIGSNHPPENVNGDADLWVWSIFKNGSLKWSESHYFGRVDRPYAMRTVDDGGILVLSVSSIGINIDSIAGVYVTKIDDQGKEEWRKIVKSSVGTIESYHSNPTSDGGFILSLSLGFKTNISKIDASGDIDWEKSFEITGPIHSTIQLNDGSYLAGGSNLEDMLILNLDEQGILNWEMTFGEDFKFDELYGLTSYVDETLSESIFLYGITKSFGADNFGDLFVAKLGEEAGGITSDDSVPGSSIYLLSVLLPFGLIIILRKYKRVKQ